MSRARRHAAHTEAVKRVLKPATDGARAEGVAHAVGAGGLNGGGKLFMGFMSSDGSVPVAVYGSGSGFGFGSEVLNAGQQWRSTHEFKRIVVAAGALDEKVFHPRPALQA